MAPRTRSQGLSSTLAQDLEVDLLRAASSKSDLVVRRLVRKYRDCITFNPNGSLDAWHKQLLRQLVPSSQPIAAQAPPVVPPLPLTCTSPVIAAHMCSQGSPAQENPVTPTEQSTHQCAGCADFQAEIDRLQQDQRQMSDLVKMLEAENQHLRSCVGQAETSRQHDQALAELSSQTSAETDSSALTPELPTPASPPAPTSELQSLKVVVRSLPCNGPITPALLLSTFIRFCSNQLCMPVVPALRVVKVFKGGRCGTGSGLFVLQTQQDAARLFSAKRQRLDAASTVTIEYNRTRAERQRKGAARRARTATCSRPTAPTTGNRADACGQPRITSSLRHDAPAFVPATSETLLQEPNVLTAPAEPAAVSASQE
jgi:hypothetical protein